VVLLSIELSAVAIAAIYAFLKQKSQKEPVRVIAKTTGQRHSGLNVIQPAHEE